jgi:hypothetical protein
LFGLNKESQSFGFAGRRGLFIAARYLRLEFNLLISNLLILADKVGESHSPRRTPIKCGNVWVAYPEAINQDCIPGKFFLNHTSLIALRRKLVVL